MDMKEMIAEAATVRPDERLLVVGIIDSEGKSLMITTVVKVEAAQRAGTQFVRDYIEPALGEIRHALSVKPEDQGKTIERTRRRPAGW